MEQAGSSGRRKKPGECLRWFHESEGLARTVVEVPGDPPQILGAVLGEVGALRHVLAEETVGRSYVCQAALVRRWSRFAVSIVGRGVGPVRV